VNMLAPFMATEFEACSAQMVACLENPHTRIMYQKALTDFVMWWRSRDELPLNRSLVQAHLDHLMNSNYSSATINQRLSAIRKVVSHAADRGLLDLGPAIDIARINSLARNPSKAGLSLSAAQAETLINAPHVSNKKGVRDRALLALLVGCALRSGEVTEIQMEDIQKERDHWILQNVVGRRGRVRAVVIPNWTKEALDAWIREGQISSGPVLRSVDRLGNVANRPISAQSVLPIVAAYGKAIGIDVKPRDLRRTCAQLCRQEGGELEQIQLLLGHASVLTTERYLGARRTAASAPNGRLRMKWRRRKLAS
jgi:integrase/recombinase XerD